MAAPDRDAERAQTSDLAQALVDSSSERQRAERAEGVLLPDELLPGTREEHTSLRDGLRKVGVRTFSILLVIVALDNLQSSGLAVLAPNIQASLHVSSAVLVFVSGISGGFLVLGVVPLGWLADRVRRGPLVGIATFFFGLMVFASGIASNIFLFFLARFGAGVSQSRTQTVHASLLDVLGEVIEDPRPIPPSLEAAFERITRIRTIKTCLVAFSAIGFGLFTGPVLGNLFLKQHFHLDAFRRGLIGTIGGIGVLVALPYIGQYYDRLYHQDPARALALIGKVLLPAAVLTPIQFFMPNIWLYAAFSVPTAVLLLTSFSMIAPILQSVAPYRLRGLTFAVSSIYVFFIGATGGAAVSSLLDISFGPRTAILMVMIPS